LRLHDRAGSGRAFYFEKIAIVTADDSVNAAQHRQMFHRCRQPCELLAVFRTDVTNPLAHRYDDCRACRLRSRKPHLAIAQRTGDGSDGSRKSV
jgi:hypothetical protein